MIVIDASAMVEWLLRTTSGFKVERRAITEQKICAPHLIDLETAQVLRKLVRRRIISTFRGAQALDAFKNIRIVRYPHNPFLPRIWKLRDTCTAYDAAYICLAEALGAPLVTHDQKLASAHSHLAVVEVY